MPEQARLQPVRDVDARDARTTSTSKSYLLLHDGQMRWTAEARNASGEVVDIVRDPHAVTATFNTWMAEESGATCAALMVSKYLHSRAFPE